MKSQLRILHLEDDPKDVELVKSMLEKEGLDFELARVESESDFVAALKRSEFDLILADYSLPSFDGLTALSIAMELCPRVPFILLSGRVGEEVAIKSLKGGATDYVLKHRMSRLVPAVRRALQEAEDRSKRKQAEEERELLSLAISQAAEIILVTDPEGAIQYVNPAFERITGYTREDVVGENPRILKSGEQDGAFYRDLWDTLTSGETWKGRFVNRRKDGTLYSEDATISPVFDSIGKATNYVAAKRDITGDLKLREQLRQSQKMEAIGQLAGGVAHDFNNILQGMLGFLSFACEGLSPDDGRLVNLLEVRKCAEKAAALTRQLLAFSRQQILEPKDIILNDVIDGLLKMVRRVLREDIELTFVSGRELGVVNADPGQVEQILMNLCVNARDAMPNGGRLTIETENAQINSGYVESHPWARSGQYALLTLADTGCGMDAETLEKVFEPFFTTKAPGEGTGLGLATVYGIVKQHDGLIHVYSEPGEGTAFKIYFPLVDRPARDILEPVEAPVKGGVETLLLGEDDETVRESVVHILEGAGYTVLSAEHGIEAVDLFEANAGEISLVILDVVMPKLGGQQVCDRIKDMNPDVHVLFMSGYSAGTVRDRLVSGEAIELIQKPFDPDSLLRKVREILDGSGGKETDFEGGALHPRE